MGIGARVPIQKLRLGIRKYIMLGRVVKILRGPFFVGFTYFTGPRPPDPAVWTLATGYWTLRFNA